MTKEKRVRVEMTDFITAWEQSGTVAEVAEKLGIKTTSVMARASKYRSLNIPLKTMQRGGRAKLDSTAAKALIASLRQATVEDVQKESDALAAKHAEKASA